MRMTQVFLVVLVAVVSLWNCEAVATKNQLVISTKNGTATAKALQKFFTEDAKQNNDKGFLKVITPSSSDEERAGAIAAGEGARAGAGTTVVSSGTTSGETVTVTIYNNNGLWQRFQRWWNRLFHTSSASTRLLREA